jgi:hypothetical protein
MAEHESEPNSASPAASSGNNAAEHSESLPRQVGGEPTAMHQPCHAQTPAVAPPNVDAQQQPGLAGAAAAARLSWPPSEPPRQSGCNCNLPRRRHDGEKPGQLTPRKLGCRTAFCATARRSTNANGAPISRRIADDGRCPAAGHCTTSAPGAPVRRSRHAGRPPCAGPGPRASSSPSRH